jgi:hypothetical protein
MQQCDHGSHEEGISHVNDLALGTIIARGRGKSKY